MKLIKTLFLIFCLFLFLDALPLNAGAHRRETDDIKTGKMISLFEKANFSISAKIYYGDQYEEEVPVNAKFYLLDKSVVEILRNARFTPAVENKSVVTSEHNTSDSDKGFYLEALARLLCDPAGDEDELLAFLFWNSLNTSKITAVETDYFGYGKSAAVKSGNYYLFGFTQIEDNIFIWNHPVFLSGTKEIEIDQNNAAAVLSNR